jgi:hypothetical protein
VIESRRENIRITVKLGHAAAGSHWLDLIKIDPYCPRTIEGDTVTLSYEFNAVYYDDVASKMEALIRVISDPNVVREVNIEELRRGRSVFVDLVFKLTRLIDKLEGNPCPTPSRQSWWQRLRGSSPAGS